MGRDLWDFNPRARAVFDEVDAALGEKLSGLIFEGPADMLDLAQNIQPAIFAVSVAAARAAAINAGFIAGHSLGEYSALCAAGAISIADAARLLRRRGELMQSAVPDRAGAMGVIIGSLPVPAICAAATKDAGGTCEPANDNGLEQVVISGNRAAVEKALELAKGQGAKIAKLLPVSVPAHSSLMQPIVEEFRAEIEKIAWSRPKIKFISNKTAAVMDDVEEIKNSLAYQMTHGVRWRECVSVMPTFGIREVIEVGPGSVLTGLVKRIDPKLNAHVLGS
jgi:[acyl-carrier-protein] S-malonyltransferase